MQMRHKNPPRTNQRPHSSPKWLHRVAMMTLFSAFLLSSCGSSGQSASDVSGSSGDPSTQAQGQAGKSSSGGDKANYSEVKTMVLDILHSTEGMNTLKDTMSSPEFKRAMGINDEDVKAAIEKTLQQGQNKSFLSEQMKDTKFAGALVKASSSTMMDIQRQLMKDPSYQQQLLTLMKSTEFQKNQFELLQSPEYRKEVMKIMTEALQNPTFRLLFMDSMKQAVAQAGGGQKSEIGKEKSKDQGGAAKGQSKDESESGSDSSEDSGSSS